MYEPLYSRLYSTSSSYLQVAIFPRPHAVSIVPYLTAISTISHTHCHLFVLHDNKYNIIWPLYYILRNICCVSHSPGPRAHPWGVEFDKYPYFTITWAARYYQAAHCIPGGVMWAAKSRPHLTHIYPHSIYTQDSSHALLFTYPVSDLHR